eukprot:11219681-Lingulodinium_polyedra.AAC.1
MRPNTARRGSSGMLPASGVPPSGPKCRKTLVMLLPQSPPLLVAWWSERCGSIAGPATATQ